MNLFYFTPQPLDQADAATRHTLEIVNGLARRGHAIRLFAPPSRRPPDLHPNAELIAIPSLRSRFLLFNSLSYYAFLPWVTFSYFWRWRPSVVYTRMSFLDWLALVILKRLYRFTYVAEVNGIRSLETQRRGLMPRVTAFLERRSLRLCDKVITVTPELSRWAMTQGSLRPQQTTVIGNGVNTELFQPSPLVEAQTKMGLDCNYRYLGFVGSLKPWHDLSTALAALPAIVATLPDVRLLVVGEGPERERLMRVADDLGILEIVVWTGSVPVIKVPVYISACELCLAPFDMGRNRSTGISPVKIFEYMSCGRAFVTSRISTAYAEQIKSWGCGLVTPPQDVGLLAQAVLHLLAEPEIREEMGRRGREAALDHCSWDEKAALTEAFVLEEAR